MKYFVVIIALILIGCTTNLKKSDAIKTKTFYYKIDTTKGRYENFDSGYVDTFSINNTEFRIRSVINSENKFVLERLNKEWELVDTFYARQCNYSIRDINNDGYPDLIADDSRWSESVFLFSPISNNFTECGFFSGDEVDSLHPLSSNDSIFYDKWDNNADNWWSYLFKIKNDVRYNLGIIEYKWGNPEIYKNNLPHWLSVRKISNDTTQKEINIIRNVNFQKFDLKKFWQKELGKFYPNPDMKPNKLDTLYEPYPDL